LEIIPTKNAAYIQKLTKRVENKNG